MQRKVTGIIGLWLVSCAVVMAADFWEEKEFIAWSDKDVEKMLSDSPWAKKVNIVMGGLSEQRNTGFTGGGGFGGGLIGGGGDGNSEFARIRRMSVNVVWMNALPVRRAMVRQAIGPNGAIPPEAEGFLTADDPYYTVAIVGLPPAFNALNQIIDAVKAATMIKRDDKAPILPQEVGFFSDSAESLVTGMFQFPRTDLISLEDDEIEFITQLGPNTEVKKKFKLKDMTFDGQLFL